MVFVFKLYFDLLINNKVKFIVGYAFVIFLIFCSIIENSIANDSNPYTLKLIKENNQKAYLSEIHTQNGNLLNNNSKYIFIENDLIYNKSIIKFYNRKKANTFFNINF